MSRTLREGFFRSAELFPQREAIRLGKASETYDALARRARRIAATLDRECPSEPDDVALTAVFGHRDITAFAAILGVLHRGHGYVPLNPIFPVDRSRTMLARSRCRAMVVDSTAVPKLAELMTGVDAGITLLLPDEPPGERLEELREALPDHTVLAADDLAEHHDAVMRPAAPDDIAYLLFTSGSTGQPKGVMVAHRNVTHFVDVMVDRYGITEADRFSQTFDLTFDLSVFDMFCAWERGACLCVPTAGQKLFPGKYIKKHEISVWFSVPSTAVMMSKLRSLKPEAYPSIRWSLFCGEALPLEMARRFAAAAPGSEVENLYGPTELTIACTLYRLQGEETTAAAAQGVVPIGAPYPGMRVLVVNDALEPVSEGEPGELLVTGPQVTPGYWEDPERTAKAFVVPPGETEVFYRTGDRVCQRPDGPLVYLGRTDHQIKIQGYRVELGEIEAVLRDVSGAEVGIAIGTPVGAPSADGVVGFVGPRVPSSDGADEAEVQTASRANLPSYMQPSRVVFVERFPLNANGKVDRKALAAEYLGEEPAA